MNIVVIGTRGFPNVMGGIETHCEELCPRIAKMGAEVTVIRRSSYVNDGLSEWNGVRLVDIPAPKKKPLETIIHTFCAVNKAKRQNADILHIHAIGPALFTPYAKLLGMKVVFTHHGPDYERKKWGKVAKAILKVGEWMGCRFADEVIVISNVIKQLTARRYGRTEHVHLIYNGVSKPEICDFPKYFKELGIEKGKYILGMCRFAPEKNLHHLVEAFSKVKAVGDVDVKLVLAGDTNIEDDYSRRLKEKARKEGVVLTGFVKGKKLHSLLTNARCYVLPSSHEGLPIALLEAMSYRLPVIVSDIPANMEIGLDQSCYFPVGNVEELARKLQKSMTEDVYRVDYDMRKYDWDVIAEQVSKVYHYLLEK